MNLTDEEFEDAYLEAVYCLQETVFVGEPVIGADGERTREIDGIQMNDYAVLNRWWGKKIADYICDGRTVAR